MLDRVLRELRDAVGTEHVVLDPAVRASHETDWTGRFTGSTPAVLRPSSTAEVEAIVEVCRGHGIPIVPQGGNTGLVGGGVPADGALVLDMRRFRRIDPVDTAARQITVGAGVSIEEVQVAAKGAGLRYAIDFGARASATVGGSIATNAGGINVLRYGSTREQLLGVEAVLGTGRTVSRLQGLVKDNTGYHLPGLLCGSEGTLGVITAARLRLVADHPCAVTALIGFESVRAAVAAVARWRSALDDLDAAELMLADGVELVQQVFERRPRFERRWPALVLIEVSSQVDPTGRIADAVAGVEGVGEVAVASAETQRRALWRLREDHTPAIATVGVPHKFDVTVPAGGLVEFIDAMPGVVRSRAPTASVWMFGHLGDGNIHVNVTGVTGSGDELDELVYRYVVEIVGCISAEHGIGRAKARWLSLDRSESELAAMRAIKRGLDPAGVLNPGAVITPTRSP
jgi:FAD/FMN-containing dehydrogenase